MFAAVSAASANELPIYAVDESCQSEWSGDVKMQNHCVGQEQKAYDALKVSWANVPEQIVTLCRDEWDKSDRYTMLKYCIDQQVEAADNVVKFNPN